jgi:hypothetical protein
MIAAAALWAAYLQPLRYAKRGCDSNNNAVRRPQGDGYSYARSMSTISPE